MSSKTNFYGKTQCDDILEPVVSEKVDYLTEYRHFFEKLSDAEPDGLALKVLIPTVSEDELPGEIFSYAMQYLDLKECPAGLVTSLCRAVLDSSTKACVEDPLCLNVSRDKRTYQSMRVMNHVVNQVHVACREHLDNALAASLPPPRLIPLVAAAVNRNRMRKMEDRHVVIDDLNYLCDIESSEAAGFYAIYDGHCGALASVYATAHLHMIMARHPFYLQNPQMAMRHAFVATDEQFINNKLIGGTTGTVCYLKGNKMLVGWVGDSSAILVKNGAVLPLVNPHRPNRIDERNRICKMGGFVSNYGTWRVNDILAVSRAIGDGGLKPCVTSEPEFLNVQLDGTEDFLVLASDGLWDFVEDNDVATEIYEFLIQYPDDLKKVADRVVQVAKTNHSNDNISVLLILLKDPHKIAEQAQHIKKVYSVNMDSSFENSQFNAQNNGFHVNANPDVAFSKDGLMFDLPSAEGIKQQNGTSDGHQDLADERLNNDWFSNGKVAAGNRAFEDDVEDEDLGPETDVDAIDDVHTSPSMEAARALAEGRPASAEFGTDDVDMMQQHEQIRDDEDVDEVRRPVREETPTPPADQGIEIGGGLVDNVAESGEESEDEWNYIKGEQKSEVVEVQSLNQSGSVPVDLTIDTSDASNVDDMNSPLNPEAPPFVPVTPTHGVSSPDITAIPARLLPDEVVSQSPQKPVPMDDIDIPDPNEFENEVSTRLADLGKTENKEYLNGHYDDSALSSQENLKETLHGNEKQSSDYNDDDIIDAPLSSANNTVDQAEFDRVQKDTTDFCDVQVAYSQHTNPTFDDEGIDEELYERLKNKERDPMSMSFYQEKDEDTCETGHNPFDLNAVQTLPNDSFEEYKDDQPQPDNSLYGINPFAGAQPDVTTNEINAAISHIDSVVTHEGDMFDSTEFIKPESPAKVEAEQFENIASPISDNISQLTEPSEQEIVEQNITEPVVEEDIAFKQEEDLCLMPTKTEQNLIESFETQTNIQPESNVLDFQSTEQGIGSPDLIDQTPYIAVCPMYPPPNVQPSDPIGFEEEQTGEPEPAILSPELIQSPEPKGELLEPFIPSPEPVALSPEVPDYQSEPLTHPLSPQPQSPFHNAASPFPEAQSPVLEADYVQECLMPSAKSPLPESEPILESKSPILDRHSPQPDIIPSSFSELSDNVCNFASNVLQQASDLLVPDSLMKEHVETNDMASSDEIQEPIIEPKQIESNLLTQIENQTCEFVESNVVEDVLKNTGEFLTDEICKPLPDSEPIEKSFSPLIDSGFDKVEPPKQITDLIDDFSNKMVKELDSDSFQIDQPIVDNLISQTVEQNIVDDLLVKTEQAIPDVEQKESKSPIDVVSPLEIAAVTGTVAAAAAAAVGGVLAATPTEDKKSKPKSATSVTKKTTTTKSTASPAKPATSPTKSAASPIKSATSPTKSAVSPVKAATPRVPAAKKPTTPVAKTPTTPKAPAPIKPKTSTTVTSPTKPAPKPLGSSTAAPKPKPTTVTAKTTSTVERKPLTNGDIKKDVVKKTTTTTTVKTTTSAKPASSAVSKTSTTTTRVSLTGAARPTTAPARTVTATRPAAPKPATAAPKVRPAPTPATRTATTKTTSVTSTKPITDKMTKDSTNKQISASRPTPAPRTGLAPKVSDLKNGTKTVTKTTTTTAKSTNPPPIRRPAGTTTKTAVTKTSKTTTKVITKEVAVEKQNGTIEKSEKEEAIMQEETCVNGTPLISDISAKEDLAQLMDDLKPCYSY